MYTISDILKISMRAIVLLLTPVLLLKPVALNAQNNSILVTVAVTPPYSTKISDYTSNPGKILVYIRNISPAGGTAMIYLQGSITGESGFRVATEEGYKPLQPLAVPPGQQVMLNVDNISDVFDENHLTYEGISQDEIINGNGLPEDFYTICLRAYNYYNDEPLSAEEPSGCSAPFHVMDVEPPMITSPMCGEEINATTPQSLIISWTHPAGAPLETRYQVTMIEVQPGDHDPEDAMNTARRPVFFQTPDYISGTSFIYGPGQPPLVEGKTYAIRVTAIDREMGTRFRNNGRSEVCSFVWKKNQILGGDDNTRRRKEKEPFIWNNITINPPPVLLPITVKGKLQYRYADPGDDKKYNLGGVNIRLVVGHAVTERNSELSPNNIKILYSPPMDRNNDPEYGKTLATAKTDASGNFSFTFLDNTEYLNMDGAGSELGDDVHRVALIVIEAPQNSFYFNPEMFIIPEQGKTVDIGPISAKVRSYQLEVTAKPHKSMWFEYLNQAVGQDKLSGINVYLCRKLEFSYQVFPMEDGKCGKNEVDESVRLKFGAMGLKVLAAGVTNMKEGKINFQRVVWHHDPTYQYYIMADCDPEGDQNFIMGAPVSFDPPANIQVSNGGYVDPAMAPYSYFMDYNTQKKTILLDPQFPKIAGKISSVEDTKPLSGVSVFMAGYYDLTHIGDMKAIYPYYKSAENESLMKCIQNSCLQFGESKTMVTAADGTFAFNDLTMLFRPSLKRVADPYRSLLMVKKGFKNIALDIGVLSYGKQVTLNNILLQKGGVLKGRVTDGETGDRVIAWVRTTGGKSYKCDRVTGAFEIPVMTVTDSTQQLIVEKDGYITETVNFIANKEITHLDVKLYQAKRRLKVYVYEKGDQNKPIREAHVQILNVTVNQNGYNYPLGYYTFDDGIAEFSFTNSGDEENAVYQIKVSMMSNTLHNYETQYFSQRIKIGKAPVVIDCAMPPAACLKGYVYAGSGSSQIVPTAKIQYNGQSDTIYSKSNGLGYYTIKNVPVRRKSQVVTAMKSQANLIGDNKEILINKASDECISQDFHLTVYEKMDITHLMGFPIEISKLEEDDGGAIWINGNITNLPSNEQFSVNGSTVIPFNKIYIKPGTLKNKDNVPIAEPVTLPLVLPKKLDVTVLNTFQGKLDNSDGLTIEKQKGSNFGVIKSHVKIPSTEFNCKNVSLPEIWLASAATGQSRMVMPVIAADKTVKKPVTLPVTGFWLCSEDGSAIKYSLPQFNNLAFTDPLKSFLQKDKIILGTVLHTNCINVTPADLNIKLGNVEITKTTMTPKPTEPIKINIDTWKLESTDFTCGTNGLTIDKALLKAQLDINVQYLEITSTSVNADKTTADFGSMKILNVVPVTVTATNKGLSCYLENGKYVWKVYATNTDKSRAAYLTGLPGLEGQELGLESIQIYSTGVQPTFAPMGDKVRMYNLVDFKPLYGSSINVYNAAQPPYFMVQGLYQPHLPYIEEFKGNIAWEKTTSNTLEFDVNNPEKINFTHNNMLFEWDINSLDISKDLFTAKGTATEPGKLGPVDIVLMHKTATSEIDIPQNAKIYITQDKKKYFNKLVGGMEVDRAVHRWGNFWFEGVMVGMNAISNNPQDSRLKFICKGAIEADGQSINVNKLNAFPGMQLTYDIANSQLHGSLTIDKNLMGMKANGTANCIFDPNGWYLNINGQLDIPGIGGCGLFGLFGDYSAVPPAIQGNYGALRCIPPEFQGRVSGFLLQGRLTKQLIPPIEWGVTLPKIDLKVGVFIGADLTMNARTWMSFDPAVNTYGIALLAEGNISGDLSGGIYSINTHANAQLGISGTYYSNGNYNVTGCGSVSAGVKAEVWLPEPVGWTGVDLTSPDVGLKMTIGNTGTDFNLLLGKCGDNLCPDPSPKAKL